MLKNSLAAVLGLILVFGGFLPGTSPEVEAAKSKKKVGFFTRVNRKVKRKVKRTVKKTKRAIVNSGYAVQDKIADAGVKAKATVTGKKPKRTHVRGHYKKGNKHSTNGHMRKVTRKKRPTGGSAGGASSYTGGFDSTFSAPPSGGSSYDPALPPAGGNDMNFSRTKKPSSKKKAKR
jgi:hypothetical protein